jgi:hypothetical protein
VKNLKLLILVFGILGLVSLFLPLGSGLPSTFKALMEGDKFTLLLMLAAFGLPTVMGAMGMAKPPFMAWQAALATAGFALGAIKTRIWETLPHIADLPISLVLMSIAAILGLIFAIMALVKPEKA